jgi:catalase
VLNTTANSCNNCVFHLIQIWPEDEFSLIEVGKLVLNENPENYFAQMEQMALSPANMIPGIESSPDIMLQVIKLM